MTGAVYSRFQYSAPTIWYFFLTVIVSDTNRIVSFYCTMHFAIAIVYLSLKKMNCKCHLKKALGRTYQDAGSFE